MKTCLKTRIILLSAVVYVSIFTEAVHAEPYTPTDGNTVIATWPVVTSPALQQAQLAKRSQPNDPIIIAKLANSYLSLANLPGQSRLYGLAQATLKPAIVANTDNTQVWLAWAQVLQHQHAFDEALAALEKVTTQDASNTTAYLLAARIYLIQDSPAQARQSCLKLLGQSVLLTTSACVLEITGLQQKELTESYNQLSTLVKRDGLPSDERGPWLVQVLADMAMRLGDFKAAENWLEQKLDSASVNYLAQWAEVQLEQENHEKVISYLTPIVNSAPEVDDLLLLQLALAEKKQKSPTGKNSANEKTSVVTNNWQAQLAERVKLREQRADIQHANEVARYYLDINPQPDKALHWAKLHVKNSREHQDKKLLERAQSAVDASVDKTLREATSPNAEVK